MFNPRRNIALRTPQPKCGTVHMGCASNCRDPERSERRLVMNYSASEQVLKFAPKEKAPNRVAQVDDAGQAIVAQIRTAADLAKEDCDRAMSFAHKLSMELRATEDRTQQMAREVEHWRDRAARVGRSSKRLKRNCSLGDHCPARKAPQSVSGNSAARFDHSALDRVGIRSTPTPAVLHRNRTWSHFAAAE